MKLLLALALAAAVLGVLPLLWWALRRGDPPGFPLDDPRERAAPPRRSDDEPL